MYQPPLMTYHSLSTPHSVPIILLLGRKSTGGNRRYVERTAGVVENALYVAVRAKTIKQRVYNSRVFSGAESPVTTPRGRVRT
jgi:hypothetical protein